ncbi:MAG: asparagine synthase (glutamine-hydrolyzing) [Bacteroidia bacterium]|nr:asparagine synthase (glutamine-hydrolyzing) [Bacteroidia bacterium]
MCGITGIWQSDSRLELPALQAFTDALTHRGPDGGGYYLDPDLPLGLGHRRLSILDLSEAGSQPMSYAGDRYQIVFNGEVFNFIEIREELQARGYRFRSDTDTEVVLAAYDAWGADCLHRFNGMWALALWDRQEQVLFLARDRFGIKPLYYHFEPGRRLAFASETWAFRSLEGFSRRWNPDHVLRALLQPHHLEGYGHTVLEGIVQLLPGHCLRFRPGDRTLRQVRWYDIRERLRPAPAGYAEQVEQFRELFASACTLRLRSDVSLATALSGGMDSSAVYCMLHQLMQGQRTLLRVPDAWQQAYVAVFPGSAVDEAAYAREVVAYVGGQAHYIEADHSRLAEEIESSTRLFDAITSTPILTVNNVYRRMRETGVVVSMDGHGVDEMLYGYRQMVYRAYEHYRQAGQTGTARMIGETLARMHPEAEWPQRHQQFVGSLRTPGLLERLRKGLGQAPAPAPDPYAKFLRQQPAAQWQPESPQGYAFGSYSALDQEVFGQFFVSTLPSLLRNFDRASMMHGIEIRMPFMDYRLVEFAFSLPVESKLGGGYTKRILRDAMQGRMPEPIRTRTYKIGIGAPLGDWFSGPLRSWLPDQVHSQAFLASPLWDGPALRDFAAERLQANRWTEADAGFLWKILNAHLLLHQS